MALAQQRRASAAATTTTLHYNGCRRNEEQAAKGLFYVESLNTKKYREKWRKFIAEGSELRSVVTLIGAEIRILGWNCFESEYLGTLKLERERVAHEVAVVTILASTTTFSHG